MTTLVLYLGSGEPAALPPPQEPGPPAPGQNTVEDENAPLALARAAFEYRDFEKVVVTLYDWVHPPRIQSRTNMIEARRLLGVSLHVNNDIRAAREEFAQLLLLDPKQKLDPFTVPPEIVATLEDVRRQLSPRLQRQEPLIPPMVTSETRTVPHQAVSWLPLGVPQFVLREEMVGILLCGAQLIGLGINITGYIQGRELQRNPRLTDPQARENLEDRRRAWLITQYGGIALFGLAYGTSVVHSYTIIQRASRTPLPIPPSAQLRWKF